MKKADFEQFYRGNIDRIHRYVFFRVGHDRAQTEDLVSEIFIKALEHFESYDPTISKSAWIYRIAHNHLANFYRDKKPQTDLEEAALTLVGEQGTETMLKLSDAIKLHAAMERLPKEDQRLVTMKYLEGYSYGDMAVVVNRSAIALKVATHRAMKKLKRLCSGLNDN